MSDCIFCKIVAKEIPADILLENSEYIAFHDLNPKAPVHILVIPKKHYQSFQCIPSAMMATVTSFIQQLVIKMGVDKSGYRLITNVGENGGQEVKHIHFHLLGGTKLKWERLSDSDPKNMF